MSDDQTITLWRGVIETESSKITVAPDGVPGWVSDAEARRNVAEFARQSRLEPRRVFVERCRFSLAQVGGWFPDLDRVGDDDG